MVNIYDLARQTGQFNLLFPELADQEERQRMEREHAEAMAELKRPPPPEPPAPPRQERLLPQLPEGGINVNLPHLSKALEKVIHIMWDNWGDIDPARLPKQGNIAREIDEALGWKPDSDGTPSRNARAIAALIKPDDV